MGNRQSIARVDGRPVRAVLTDATPYADPGTSANPGAVSPGTHGGGFGGNGGGGGDGGGI